MFKIAFSAFRGSEVSIKVTYVLVVYCMLYIIFYQKPVGREA